jgi:S-adenosylmethionine synthetase
MQQALLSALESINDPVEVVERKGLGHPDTICDSLAEALSRDLCREYRRRFGDILHHNVDKALLSGGRAAPALGGGQVIAPINIYLAGRAISSAGGEPIPVEEIAIESSRTWLKFNLHALDAEQHVRIHALIHPGSQDLQALFSRREAGQTPLANDTSIGVGYAPLSALEEFVLAIEKTINGPDRCRQNPGWGEDVKVMGIRCGEEVRITVACAMIGCCLGHVDDYLHEKAAIADLVRKQAEKYGFGSLDIVVNAADDIAAGNIYLTVTGTSAEAGDDGQVGRGNRVTGLITPCRPMSLEAPAGKNPITHVGKIYSVLAQDMADKLVREMPEIAKAQCLMVSRIGSPLSRPALLQIKIATRDGIPAGQLQNRIDEIAADRLAHIPRLVDDFVAGKIEIF